jgi:hypothetical protein
MSALSSCKSEKGIHIVIFDKPLAVELLEMVNSANVETRWLSYGEEYK